MKVILDAGAVRQPLTGIGRYVLELANGLKNHHAITSFMLYSNMKMASTDPTLLLKKKSMRDWIVKYRELPFIYAARLGYRALTNLFLRWNIKSEKHTIYHAPNYFVPSRMKVPTIATVHDFSILHYPQYHPAERVKYFNYILPKSMEDAHHLITDSAFIRSEVIQLFSVSPDKVSVVPLGVSDQFRPQKSDEVNGILQKYDISYGQYFLSVATLEPRKNFHNLLLAYMQLPKATQQKYPLVLVGAMGWKESKLYKKILNLQQRGVLKYLGFVPEKDLPGIYAGARAFLYPSFYEGFGLPVLEAMASGVPVLTSDCSSMPEVVGDTGILVDPYDVDAISCGFTKFAEDAEFCRASVDRGLQLAANYTWKQCVENTISVYEKVLEQKRVIQ